MAQTNVGSAMRLATLTQFTHRRGRTPTTTATETIETEMLGNSFSFYRLYQKYHFLGIHESRDFTVEAF